MSEQSATSDFITALADAYMRPSRPSFAQAYREAKAAGPYRAEVPSKRDAKLGLELAFTSDQIAASRKSRPLGGGI